MKNRSVMKMKNLANNTIILRFNNSCLEVYFVIMRFEFNYTDSSIFVDYYFPSVAIHTYSVYVNVIILCFKCNEHETKKNISINT